jgi:hypothetical protein
MRPLIQHELMKDRIADLHREADRERMARAASRPRHTQQEKPRRNLVLGRTATAFVRHALTVLRPSQAR